MGRRGRRGAARFDAARRMTPAELWALKGGPEWSRLRRGREPPVELAARREGERSPLATPIRRRESARLAMRRAARRTVAFVDLRTSYDESAAGTKERLRHRTSCVRGARTAGPPRGTCSRGRRHLDTRTFTEADFASRHEAHRRGRGGDVSDGCSATGMAMGCPSGHGASARTGPRRCRPSCRRPSPTRGRTPGRRRVVSADGPTTGLAARGQPGQAGGWVGPHAITRSARPGDPNATAAGCGEARRGGPFLVTTSGPDRSRSGEPLTLTERPTASERVPSLKSR